MHWLTATSFVLLALTGLNITFGKMALLPLLGPSAFSTWSLAAKYAHNFLSFPFTLGLILIFFSWIAGNIPNRVDIQWLKAGGGVIGDAHPPADRFNAGEKGVYWLAVLAGTMMAVSGYVLMFPFYGTTIADMQLAQMVHGTVAVLFIAVILAHAYIGTVGEEGAFEAMGEGTVDLNWAKQHHSLWLEEKVRGHDNLRQQPATTPAE
jgi:formate dehydrogenase subunit gamma